MKCDVSEKTKQKKIALNMEHKRLENELLKLGKSHEYRCCPPSLKPESTKGS